MRDMIHKHYKNNVREALLTSEDRLVVQALTSTEKSGLTKTDGIQQLNYYQSFAT